MAVIKNLNLKILSAAASAGAALLGQRLLTKSWRRVTGEEPPDPADPQVPAAKAIGWLVLSTLFVSIVQLLIQRGAASKTNPVTRSQEKGSRPFSA